MPPPAAINAADKIEAFLPTFSKLLPTAARFSKLLPIAVFSRAVFANLSISPIALSMPSLQSSFTSADMIALKLILFFLLLRLTTPFWLFGFGFGFVIFCNSSFVQLSYHSIPSAFACRLKASTFQSFWEGKLFPGLSANQSFAFKRN